MKENQPQEHSPKDIIETYPKIIESHPKQKAVIASGLLENEKLKTASSLGITAFVSKPYTLKKIGLDIRKGWIMNAEKPSFNPYLALALGIISISTGAIFARLSGEADALVISAYRVGLASIVLFPIAWFNIRDELRSLSMADLRLAVLSGFF